MPSLLSQSASQGPHGGLWGPLPHQLLLSHQTQPSSEPHTSCFFYFKFSLQVCLRYSLSLLPVLCSGRFPLSHMHSLSSLLCSIPLLRYRFPGLFIIGLSPVLGYIIGQELWLCSLMYPQNLDSNLTYIWNAVHICWRHQWTGPRLFSIPPGVPPPDSKLAAMSKLIRQKTELETIAWSRQGGYLHCIIWGFTGQGCLTPK